MTVETPVQTYAELLDAAFDEQVTAWTAQAELDHRFPRPLLEHLGAEGVFVRKWEDRKVTDLHDHFALGAHLGALGSAAIGVGVSLHDSAIAILRRFGRNDYLRDLAQRALAAETVLCIGASEEQGGSDLQNSETRILPENGGFQVVGHKKFVSLSPIADHVFVVCRGVDDGPDVGGTYLLARTPGELGTHLALTTARMSAGDAIAAGFADHYVPTADLDAFVEALHTGTVDTALSLASPAPDSPLADRR